MRAAFVLFALVAVAGAADAGNYTPPPGDCCPQWSPKGTQIVFTTNRKGGTIVGAVSSTGGPEQFVPGIPVGARSPDWKHVAYTTQKGGATWLTVANVDGSGEQLLAQTTGDFAWSPDSTRLAFVAKDHSLDVIGVDGKGLVNVVSEPAAMPAWRPDGKDIAYVATAAYGGVGGVSYAPLSANGSNPPQLGGPGTIEPAWSPDGKQLSYLDGRTIRVTTFSLYFSIPERRYVLPAPPLLNNGWFPDGTAILYDAEPMFPADMDSTEIGALVNGRPFQDELVRLDLKTGKRRILSFGAGAAFSADGKSLAFSSGGECRDREGIYAMRVDGTQRRRLTNDCAIRGTARADTLRGTPLADDLLGLGGNDRLFASDPGYVGDTLDGGPGNDVLTGGSRQDTLYGGPGDDVLSGGPSGDALVGGRGHDRLNGQGGRDTIYAVDGQRDRISCGPNAFGKHGRDVVYADKIDVIASDCEIVHRS